MPKQPYTRNSIQGFTLLEILIAMAIFTLIGLASTSVLTSVIDSDELSTERFEKLEELQRAMLTLERDILQAAPRPVRIEGQMNQQVMLGGADMFESEADGLGFVHGGWHNPQFMLPRSTLQAVSYRLQEGQLQRLYGNYLDNVIGYEPKIKILLNDVDDFRVYFLAPDEEEAGEGAWQDSYAETILPRGMAIELSSKDFGFIRREFLLAGGGYD
ncbi:MAG: general secretion pathway protein J [Paraglaciecola sp.]|jgi:general secretion pathway protein J